MAMRRWLPACLLLAGLAGCGGKGDPKGGEGHSAKADAPDEKAEAHVTVKTEPARLGSLAESVGGLGRCEAIPDHLATLTPAVEGHVHELLIQQGEPVKKGQAIVTLDETTALADLDEKTGTRDSLKAALELLKAVPRPEDRRANELAIESAKVAVERARRVADRLRPLLERREVSEQQVFDADQAVLAAKLQVQTAEAALKLQMTGPRPEAIAEAEAKVKTADGAVSLSKAHLAYHTIRSPIDGVLDSLTCHPGQTIAIGANVGEVVDSDELYAAIWLAPRPAQSVKVGQKASVGDADSRAQTAGDKAETSAVVEGKVAYVGKVADPQTGNVPVRVLLANKDGRLTLGQSAKVAIIVADKPAVLTVPAAAIVDEGEGPVLGVVREANP